MKHKKHKKTIRKKMYKPKNKSMKKIGGGDHDAAEEPPADEAALPAEGEVVPVLTDSDFITRKEHRETFLDLFNEIKELKQIIDNNKNIEDLYKILRANNIEAYNFNDPRRAQMDTLMQNDYKRFRWHRLCMLRTFVGISEWVMENSDERKGKIYVHSGQVAAGAVQNLDKKGEFFNAVYGTFPAYIFTKKYYLEYFIKQQQYASVEQANRRPPWSDLRGAGTWTLAETGHPDGKERDWKHMEDFFHRYFDYNKKNSDCCLYDEESLERSHVDRHHWFNVYLRTSEDRGDGRTGQQNIHQQHSHPINFSSYKMLSPNSPFIQVEGVGRNHAVEFDHKGVKYLKDAINNVWELENPEYVASMHFITSPGYRQANRPPYVGNQRDYILRLKDISLGSIRHINAPIDIEMPEDRLIDVTTLDLHPSQESRRGKDSWPRDQGVVGDVAHFVPLIDGDEWITEQEVAAGKKYNVRGGKYLGWYDEEEDDIKQPLNDIVRLGLTGRTGLPYDENSKQESVIIDAIISRYD